tara:strand:+ start:374 stop:631 length:258 start_codon:yes stop_codon:yes gene_type:complete
LSCISFKSSPRILKTENVLKEYSLFSLKRIAARLIPLLPISIGSSIEKYLCSYIFAIEVMSFGVTCEEVLELVSPYLFSLVVQEN